MIKANELRIGNFVKFISDDVDFEVVEIDCFNYNNKVNGIDGELINPIPLTPEILEKAGVNLYDGLTKYKLGTKYKIDLKRKEKSKFKVNAGGKYVIIAEIEHLHQLQNLYHALTGEELEINL